MTRRYRTLASLALLATFAFAPTAGAGWPPDPSLTRDQLADPANWPNDPEWSGQWASYSWIPAATLMDGHFRPQEIPLGSGNNTDAAWQITIGDPRVLIAILDSGIEWDSDDLITKVAINTGELPQPQDASGATQPYDANGDGVVNVLDYLNDARIPCGTALPHPLRGCMGADGMPNDPNQNGKFDAGDLIRVFSDGVDDDHNGYVDDIAGWDFYKDDNDPYDDTRYGHGTGEAHDSSSETNNGIDQAGACPRCMFIPLRAGDSFVADVNDFAQAAVYAVDLRYGGNRVRVIQEALGTLDNSRYAMQAIDYAYAHDVVVMGSAADENSRHHNVPGTNNHVVYVHAVRYDGHTPETSSSFMAFNTCTNYGGQLQLSVAGESCSSQATGESSGVAGLIESEALQSSLDPPLSAEETRQIFIESVDDIDIPESQPTNANYDSLLFPSLPGWDQRFGYGRVNARRAVEWVRDGRIPPEVDITSPRWFMAFDPDRPGQAHLEIDGRIAARRAPSFDYRIEWAAGIEPAEGTWQMIRAENNVTAPLTNALATLDLTTLHIDNPGEVENRYTVTLRIRATAHYGGTLGDVPGEARRVFYVRRDPDMLQNFPVDATSSGESSPHIVDLDGDGHAEVVIATSDGLVHAIEANGTELAGWPAHTNPLLGLDATRTPSYRGSAAYSGTTPAIDPDRIFEGVVATPAIGDLDGDGHPEVVVAGFRGTVYVFRSDGTAYGHGFPRLLPDVPSSATAPNRILDRSIFGSPVLVDLDRDGHPEIVFGAGDGYLYALDAATAADHAGFPVQIHFPAPGNEYNRVFGSVGVGHIDGDDIPDIVVVSNEKLAGDRNTGAIYIVHGDGNLHAGGPFHPNWPIELVSQDILPMVAEGISSSPAIADVDGDGLDDLSLAGSAGSSLMIGHGVQPMHPLTGIDPQSQLSLISTLSTNSRGRFSNSRSNPASFVNAFALGSFGDLTNDGAVDYVLSGGSFSLLLSIEAGGHRVDFEHLVGAWDARSGTALPGFPRVIEDYTFFMNPAIADISGDAYPEAIVGSGGYYLHAMDGCGREPAGFPKFTGQWIIPSPAVGDLDGDGQLELVTATRSGQIYAWHTHGSTTGSVQWPTFRHDNANTGNYGTGLNFGVRHVDSAPALNCPLPPAPDAGVVHDAGADAAGPPHATGGCGCRAPSRVGTRAEMVLGLLAVVFVRRRRRRGSTYAR